MAKRNKRASGSKAVTITAKDLSKKVETRGNSARLASIKPKSYKGTSSTEIPVKRTTYKGGSLTQKKVTVGGKIKLTKYDSKTFEPKKKRV